MAAPSGGGNPATRAQGHDATVCRGAGAPELAVYVHVPFCAARCHYCDFVTYTGLRRLHAPYADALVREAEIAVGMLDRSLDATPVTSVFFGGGTPTLLDPAAVGRLLSRLGDLLAVAPDAEITVEANPETVDDRTAEGLVGAGVNRVSLGAQSFDPRVLAALGRTHGTARPGEAMAALRRAGLRRLNLDLIFGGPEEDAASWDATLEAAVALDPEHLSAYALTIEPATRFGRMVAAGQLVEPDEELLADRYDAACAMLRARGYAHYEVSNWAQGPVGAGGIPAGASRHNLTYWRRGWYLGLGAGAHEFTPGPAGAVRRWNAAGVPAYLAAVRSGRRPTAGAETLTSAEARLETLALRLRTAGGLSLAEARALGVDLRSPAVADARSAGLLARGSTVRLTERGMFLHSDLVHRLAS